MPKSMFPGLAGENLPSVSIVVIAVPSHEEFLSELSESLEKQLGSGDELILVLSGFYGKAKKRTQIVLGNHSRRIVWTRKSSAGRNRNIGWRIARNSIVAFHDADDFYHPCRVGAAKQVFAEFGPAVFLHSYAEVIPSRKPGPWKKFNFSELRQSLISESEFYAGTLVENPRNREEELRNPATVTNLLFNRESEYGFPIHHAHAFFRRDLPRRFRFNNSRVLRNEDGILVRDLLEAGEKIVVSSLVLSQYRKETSTEGQPNPWRVLHKLAGAYLGIRLRI